MKLREWNEVLDYAEALEEQLNVNGYNIRFKPYQMYDGRQGINIMLLDNRGNVFKSYCSGIHDTLKEYRDVINYYVEKLKEE